MFKKVLLLVALLLATSSAHAQMLGTDQRPQKGNLHTRGLNVATYLRNGVNVTQFPFGAIADNATDNTTAFIAAYNTGFPVYVPESNKCFAVNNLSLPSTSVTFGDTGPVYSTVSVIRSCITGTASATVILNPNGNISQVIQNMDIIGDTTGGFSKAITCIAGGSTQMSIINSSVRYCGGGTGNGGGWGDGTNITHTATAINVVFYGNGNANNSANIENFVDSHFIGGFSVSGYFGFDAPAGANNNHLDGVKTEFNNAFGENFQSTTSGNVVHGGTCDNNAFGCASFQAAKTTSIIGQYMFRNGRGTNGSTFNYAQNQQIYFNGGASNIVIDGVVTQTGINDGGGGTLGPPYGVFFNNSNDNYITITNSDMTGNTGGAIVFNSSRPTNFIVDNVQGFQSYQLGEHDLSGELIVAPLATPSAPTIATSGTAGSTTVAYKSVAFTSSGFQTAVSSAGTIATSNATLTTSNFNIVTPPPVNGAAYYDIYRTTSPTSPSTTGKIARIYAGTLTLNDTGLAGDSSSPPTTNSTGGVTAAGFQSTGTTFSMSGCSATSATGGQTAGTYASGTSGVCTVTVTFAGQTAAHGWDCNVDDRTTTADLISETGTTSTTATFSGTTASGDVIGFHCVGY